MVYINDTYASMYNHGITKIRIHVLICILYQICVFKKRIFHLMMNKIDNDQKIAAGRRIKMARTLAGISRKDLDTKYGVNIHTLQSWELGRNTLTEKAASQLVEIFHGAGVICSTQWLLDGIGKTPALLGEAFTPYSTSDTALSPLLTVESIIQKEINFFETNNPNAHVVMVNDDGMEPRYTQGDFVGGIKYQLPPKIDGCMGRDCIVEIAEGTFFRRLLKRKNEYALACLNAQTTTEQPVIFSKKILAATPIIWHRWKFETPEE